MTEFQCRNLRHYYWLVEELGSIPIILPRHVPLANIIRVPVRCSNQHLLLRTSLWAERELRKNTECQTSVKMETLQKSYFCQMSIGSLNCCYILYLGGMCKSKRAEFSYWVKKYVAKMVQLFCGRTSSVTEGYHFKQIAATAGCKHTTEGFQFSAHAQMSFNKFSQ